MGEIREGWNCPVVSAQWQPFPGFLLHQKILPKPPFSCHLALHAYSHAHWLELSVTCLMKLRVRSDIFYPQKRELDCLWGTGSHADHVSLSSAAARMLPPARGNTQFKGLCGCSRRANSTPPHQWSALEILFLKISYRSQVVTSPSISGSYRIRNINSILWLAKLNYREAKG